MKGVVWISGLALLAAGAATAWLMLPRTAVAGLMEPVMEICSTIPDMDEVETKMTALGWQPLDPARQGELASAAGLFHLGARRAGVADFVPGEERDNYEARKAEMLTAISEGGRAFGRDNSAALAFLGHLEGVPFSIGCDVFLPGDMVDAAFETRLGIYDLNRDENGWASSVMIMSQQPRPGLWVADLVGITPESELTEFLGAIPKQTYLARTAFRGELAQ